MIAGTSPALSRAGGGERGPAVLFEHMFDSFGSCGTVLCPPRLRSPPARERVRGCCLALLGFPACITDPRAGIAHLPGGVGLSPAGSEVVSELRGSYPRVRRGWLGSRLAAPVHAAAAVGCLGSWGGRRAQGVTEAREGVLRCPHKLLWLLVRG